MGLYESELTKQIHLRNKQKQEWDMMKKKMVIAEERKVQERAREQDVLEKEQREEDRIELEETRISKNLCAAMVKTPLASGAEALQKVVEVLKNQNGNK